MAKTNAALMKQSRRKIIFEENDFRLAVRKKNLSEKIALHNLCKALTKRKIFLWQGWKESPYSASAWLNCINAILPEAKATASVGGFGTR